MNSFPCTGSHHAQTHQIDFVGPPPAVVKAAAAVGVESKVRFSFSFSLQACQDFNIWPSLFHTLAPPTVFECNLWRRHIVVGTCCWEAAISRLLRTRADSGSVSKLYALIKNNSFEFVIIPHVVLSVPSYEKCDVLHRWTPVPPPWSWETTIMLCWNNSKKFCCMVYYIEISLNFSPIKSLPGEMGWHGCQWGPTGLYSGCHSGCRKIMWT